MTKKKKILLGADAREQVTAGVNFYADALQITLGPYGDNFILEKGKKITNDGRNIGTELQHEDEIAEEVVQKMKEISMNTELEVKDASTTAPILARAIYNEAIKYLPSRSVAIGKMNSAEIKAKIASEHDEVIAKLDEMKEDVTTIDQLRQVALTVTQNKELGDLMAEAQWKIGPAGIMLAEEHIGKTHEVEEVRGLLLDNGLASTQVITNHEKQSLEVSDCRVILTTNTVSTIEAGKGSDGKPVHRLPIEGLIKSLAQSGTRQVVFMARAFTSEAITVCMEYMRQGFAIYPVNCPYVDAPEIMKDLEAVHGGRFVDAEAGSLSTISESDVGYAENVTVERFRSIFIGKKDDASKERIERRIEEIREKLKGDRSDFERDNLERRIAQLSGGFALIRIGSILESDRKEMKDKADDAVGTLRIALEGGVVPGGGLALKKIADSLPDSYILKGPLQVVYKHIMSTAPAGFVIEDWVKDPLKTIKVALKYACKGAASLASLGGGIATKHDKPRYVQEATQTEDIEE